MSKGIMNRRDKMIWDNSALPTIDDVMGKIEQIKEDCTYTAGDGISIDEDNVISSTGNKEILTCTQSGQNIVFPTGVNFNKIRELILSEKEVEFKMGNYIFKLAYCRTWPATDFSAQFMSINIESSKVVVKTFNTTIGVNTNASISTYNLTST